MDIDKKKYKVVNLMYWDEYQEDDNVECTSLSDEYTKIMCEDEDFDVYPDQNKYIGKPRYFYMTLEKIQKHIFSQENIDLFCKNNPECYGELFHIYNVEFDVETNVMVTDYKPQK